MRWRAWNRRRRSESEPTIQATAEIASLPLFPAHPGRAGEFQETACRFILPEGLKQGKGVICGFLTVPEQRAVKDGRLIQLHVAILHRPAGASHPDPVIFLSGGPGGSTLEGMNSQYEALAEPVFTSGRDLVVFDQRGIGFSRPALDCPEYDQQVLDLQDRKLDGRQVAPAETIAVLEQNLRDCNVDLRRIADLTAYNSAASADDVDDLRHALGYAQVNLWGGSYGTRLALEVMRRAAWISMPHHHLRRWRRPVAAAPVQPLRRGAAGTRR